MSASILVATTQAAFGELIRLSLEESGQYQVRLVRTAKEARMNASHSTFQAAILDADLADESVATLGQALRNEQPSLRLIVIPPDNNPKDPSLDGLVPNGFISSPFYLPDLLDLLSTSIADNASPDEPTTTGEALPDWARDPERLRGALEKQLKNPSAVAALLCLDGELYANAGTLDRSAAEALTATLMRYWNKSDHGDLLQFVRLSNSFGDCLTYATGILDRLVLVLVFEPGASLSQVRQLAKHLVLTLTYSPTESTAASQQPALVLEEQALLSDEEEEQTALEEDEPGDEADEDELEKIDIASLLGNIPSPDPLFDDEGTGIETELAATDWLSESYLWTPANDSSMEEIQEEDCLIEADSSENSLASVQETAALKPIEIIPGSIAPVNLLDLEPEMDPLSDTHPQVVATLSRTSQLEPVSPALSLLDYTCVLVPRMPQHYLTGELADRLAQWVPQLCLAFGWRLEGIAVRPEYLQWMVQVAPTVSPGNLVRIVRQRTSLSIFNTFEHLLQQNPSGDFWATGYLIVSGALPPSAQMLREYISQTRKRQGIQK